MANFCSSSMRNSNTSPKFSLVLALICATLVIVHVAAADTADTGRPARALNYVYTYSGGSRGRPSTTSSSSSGSYGGKCSHEGSTTTSNVDSYDSSAGSYGSSDTSNSGYLGYSSRSSYGYGYGSSSSDGVGHGKGTPKFWVGHPELVPNFLSLASNIPNVFGHRILKDKDIGPSISELTILGALKEDINTNTMAWLVRESSAAYINSYAYVGEFPLAPSEVVSRFNNALDSPELTGRQAIQFQEFNENV